MEIHVYSTHTSLRTSRKGRKATHTNKINMHVHVYTCTLATTHLRTQGCPACMYMCTCVCVCVMYKCACRLVCMYLYMWFNMHTCTHCTCLHRIRVSHTLGLVILTLDCVHSLFWMCSHVWCCDNANWRLASIFGTIVLLLDTWVVHRVCVCEWVSECVCVYSWCLLIVH